MNSAPIAIGLLLEMSVGNQDLGKVWGRAVGFLAFAAALLLMTTACTPSSPEEQTGEAASAAFVNGDFEPPGSTVGQVPPTPWVLQTYLNPTGVTISNPQTRAGLNLAAGGHPLTTVVTGTNQTDPTLGSSASLRYCRFGTQCARINFHSNNANGNGKNVNALSQTMTVGSGDIDPNDGLAHVRFAVAPVLQDPNHTPEKQPYFYVQLTNLTKGNAVLFQDYNYANQPGVTWKTFTTPTGSVYRYTDWTLVDIAPGDAMLQAGDQVNLEVIAAGCQPGAHEGYVYLDAVGAIVPGLFVSGTGPAQVVPGSNITYTLSYKNGASAAESSVVIDFTTPPGTTFQGITPPAGATCTTPAVGSAGTIVCTFANPLAAGAAGSFTITVGLNAGVSGTVTAGQYDIKSAQESPLIGNKINTLVGCATDADCSAGFFCMMASAACTAKIANGGGLPTDAPHTNPTLDGVCTAAAGVLVCQSGVCDVNDNLCGYANGDGPCTVANQATVCRSGICGTSGVCTAAATCNGDADCTGGQWCLISAHTCTPKIPNGGNLPNDPGHTSPVLNGTCTSSAGMLVCASGVCDTDNKCGFANGDGPCTAANGATLCRSGVCSVNLLCMPAGGCNVDADCTGGTWCDMEAHTCKPKLANGAILPTDDFHTSPVLNGACTAAAAALVCLSGVCDTDNKCGLMNGDGACTAINGPVVCRSGVCDTDGLCGLLNGHGTCTVANGAVVCRAGVCDIDGLCGLDDGHGPCTAADKSVVCRSGDCSQNGTCMPLDGCNVDADCTGSTWCMVSAHTCTTKLPNDMAIPIDGPHTSPTLDGTCTSDAGALVCQSGVCDADDRCGFDVGGGPCDAGDATVVCRSLTCSQNGTCMPVGGCNVDADCAGDNWCVVSMHACTPKLGNGAVMPVDVPHLAPTLDGTCTDDAAAAVCVSAVCDQADDRCGFANGDGTCDAGNADVVCRSTVCDADQKCGYLDGDGPCTLGSGPVVCRSGVCSPNGAVCMPVGGCAVDADCGAGEWCNSETFSCVPKLANEQPIPSVAGHAPTLTGKCSTAAGDAVCDSGACDTSDDLCGFADGSGPCTAIDGSVVCRSGICGAMGVCGAAVTCTADADCQQATQYCDTQAHHCVAKLPNGGAMPVVSGHTPALDGVCSPAEATVVCQSGVCDVDDDKCGYENGDGPCTISDAGTVCRSSTCSPNGSVCVPSGGCAVDADCTATQWCNTELFACVSKLPNGGGIPTVGGHAPALAGKCDTAVGAAVCQSGVCDVHDDKCGYADGSGPCTDADAGIVCREGACSQTNVCMTPDGCKLDIDCNSYQYCDTGVQLCAPKLPNGSLMPGVPNHAPALDGTCSDTAAKIVCLSGVCDTADGKCGHGIGEGPCDAGNGALVCRSTICATSGPNAHLCVECVANTQCEGSKPVCDTDKNACGQCTPAEDDACAGATPVCVSGPDTCAPCDGDLNSGAPHPCAHSEAPYCFLAGPSQGACGLCASNADCLGHVGPTCDKSTGACTTGCTIDADCPGIDWCNAPVNGVGACVPKLDNGVSLPSAPPEVSTCTDEVGQRVCKSGVCDSTDDKCGLPNGAGPCVGGDVCRSGVCDPNDQKCGFADGDGPCTSDAVCRNGSCDLATSTCAEPAAVCTKDSDCEATEYCKADGTCADKLPEGRDCTADNQCQSGGCHDKKCDVVLASGNGVACAARSAGRSEQGSAAAVLGLMLAAAALARRRSR